MFSIYDDVVIRNHVETFGATKWSNLALKVVGKSQRQVRDRWCYVLDPSIDHTPMRPEEDARLLELYTKSGSFSAAASNMPGRTYLQLKNRFASLTRRLLPEEVPRKPEAPLEPPKAIVAESPKATQPPREPRESKTPSPRKPRIGTPPRLVRVNTNKRRLNGASEHQAAPSIPPPLRGPESIRFTFTFNSAVAPIPQYRANAFRSINSMLAKFPDARKQRHEGWAGRPGVPTLKKYV